MKRQLPASYQCLVLWQHLLPQEGGLVLLRRKQQVSEGQFCKQAQLKNSDGVFRGIVGFHKAGQPGQRRELKATVRLVPR